MSDRPGRLVTLVHGWGFDATLWRTVCPLLDGLELEIVDLGFFGQPLRPAPTSKPRVAVGHSLGVAWWLSQSETPWTTLVSINGFSRFSAATDFPQGVAPRVIRRMIQRFSTAPADVLADFHIACGVADERHPPLPGDTQPLSDGLEQLQHLDGRASLNARRQDIWALASCRDAIVPPAMSTATFAALPAGRLHWADAGDHVLPLSHPQECAALIKEAASHDDA